MSQKRIIVLGIDKNRADTLAKNIGFRGHAKKIFDLFVQRGEVTMDEMVCCLFEDDPEGGPLNAEGYVRVLLSSMRKRLKGRAEISQRRAYTLQPLGVIKKNRNNQ